MKLKVGLIGYGLAGKFFHAPFLNANLGFNIKTIVSSRKEEIKADYPDAQVTQSVDDLLNDKDIDLIIITSPNHSHFEYAKKAMESGKHVVTEKPVTPTSEEAGALIRIAAKNKVKMTVFQNRRWDGDFLTVKEMLKNQLLGIVDEYESHFDRYAPEFDPDQWRNQNYPGSGMLYDIGPHLIDQAIQLFGMPDAVSAIVENTRKKGDVDDSFIVNLIYPDLKATLVANVLAKESTPRFYIKGSQGNYIKYGIDPQIEQLMQGILPGQDNFGHEPADKYGVFKNNSRDHYYQGKIKTYQGNYMGFYDNLYDAIVNNANLQVDPVEAMHNIFIIEKAFESSKLRQPVSIDLK
jgi:scyllo-inositol 2-dehydrogenase (NADP+)